MMFRRWGDWYWAVVLSCVMLIQQSLRGDAPHLAVIHHMIPAHAKHPVSSLVVAPVSISNAILFSMPVTNAISPQIRKLLLSFNTLFSII